MATQAGVDPSQAKAIHIRPAMIQELTWSPQPLGGSSETEAAKEVVFSFYDGQLFRILVDYDRYQTEGLTTDDMIDAFSASFGIAAKTSGLGKVARGRYGNQEEVLAQWQDPEYRYDLFRSAFGPSYRLIGVQKGLDVQAQAATLEAKRLDDQEAPQRDAARIASQEEAATNKLERARLVNKPKFRP